MSAIYEALIRLNEKVIGLEKSAEIPLAKIRVLDDKLTTTSKKLDDTSEKLTATAEKLTAAEKKKSGKQAPPDLFSVGMPANKNIGFDTSVLARKLDMAIEKVEQVLKEG